MTLQAVEVEFGSGHVALYFSRPVEIVDRIGQTRGINFVSVAVGGDTIP